MNNNLVNEQWKVINDYPMYEVSTEGRIKSHYSGKILKPLSNWEGYLRINLYKDGKMTTKQIHRLVAIAFIPNPEHLPCIDHISGCKSDNRLCNLRWCTHKLNQNFDNHRPMTEEVKARLREIYQRNKDYYNNYYQDNKELLSEQKKKYYQYNKEQISEQLKLYYQANRLLILDKMKQKYQDKRESRLEQTKQYYLTHKKQKKDYMKLYYQQNKERWQKYQQNKNRKD